MPKSCRHPSPPGIFLLRPGATPGRPRLRGRAGGVLLRASPRGAVAQVRQTPPRCCARHNTAGSAFAVPLSLHLCLLPPAPFVAGGAQRARRRIWRRSLARVALCLRRARMQMRGLLPVHVAGTQAQGPWE
jgi:hypothetical protein